MSAPENQKGKQCFDRTAVDQKDIGFWDWLWELDFGEQNRDLSKLVPGLATLIAVLWFVVRLFFEKKNNDENIFTAATVTYLSYGINIFILLFIMVTGFKRTITYREPKNNKKAKFNYNVIARLERHFINYIRCFFFVELILYVILSMEMRSSQSQTSIQEKETVAQILQGRDLCRQGLTKIKTFPPYASLLAGDTVTKNLDSSVGHLLNIEGYAKIYGGADTTLSVDSIAKVRKWNNSFESLMVNLFNLARNNLRDSRNSGLLFAFNQLYRGSDMINNACVNFKAGHNTKSDAIHVAELFVSNIGALLIFLSFMILYTRSIAFIDRTTGRRIGLAEFTWKEKDDEKEREKTKAQNAESANAGTNNAANDYSTGLRQDEPEDRRDNGNNNRIIFFLSPQNLFCADYASDGDGPDPARRAKSSRYTLRLLRWSIFVIAFMTVLQFSSVIIASKYSGGFGQFCAEAYPLFRLASGMLNSLAMFMLFARFESGPFKSSLSILLFLYLYAAIQAFYGLFGLTFLDTPYVIADLTVNVAFVGKCFLYLYILWIFKTDRLMYYFYINGMPPDLSGQDGNDQNQIYSSSKEKWDWKSFLENTNPLEGHAVDNACSVRKEEQGPSIETNLEKLTE